MAHWILHGRYVCCWRPSEGNPCLLGFRIRHFLLSPHRGLTTLLPFYFYLFHSSWDVLARIGLSHSHSLSHPSQFYIGFASPILARFLYPLVACSTSSCSTAITRQANEENAGKTYPRPQFYREWISSGDTFRWPMAYKFICTL